MSTESHKTAHHPGAEPVNDTVAFETRDVKARTIYAYLIALGVAVILSYVVCVFILRALSNMAAQSDTPPPPVREQMGKDYHTMPPEPRLQGVPGHTTDPQLDLRLKNEADTEANEKAGWIDQSSGIAQIPVKDAMKIIAEKGLSDVSAPSAEKKKK
jgi:hypothetical protein